MAVTKRKRGSVSYQKDKSRIRYTASITTPWGERRSLDSSIKVPLGVKGKELKAYEAKAQEIIDNWVEKNMEPEAETVSGVKQFTVSEWFQYADDNLFNQKDSTTAIRIAIIRKHWLAPIGSKKIQDVTALDVQSVIKKLEAGGMSHRSVENVRNTLLSYMGKACDFLPYMAKNPVSPTVVDKKRAKPQKSRWLKPDESMDIIRLTRTERSHGIVLLGLMLGLRRGEILGLRWKDVDIEGRTIHVNSTVVDVKGKSVLKDHGKSGSADRRIPIPQTVAEWLAWEKMRSEGDFVIGGKHFVSTPTFNRMVVEAIKVAGLEGDSRHQDQKGANKITAHTLRHSFSVYLGQSGLDDYHMCYLFGHAQKTVMGKVYRKPVMEEMAKAVDKIEKMIFGIEPLVSV